MMDFYSQKLSEFLKTFAITGIPIAEDNRIIGVVLIYHKQSIKIEKELLNIYLAIINLIGTRRERLLALEQLHQYNIKLEEEVRQRTQELNNTNRELEALVETIPDGILVIQPNGQIKLANKTCNQISKRLIGTPLTAEMNILEIPGDYPFNNALKKLFEMVQSKETDINLKIEAEPDFWLEIFSATFRLPENDEILGIIIEIRDISPFIEFDTMRKQFVSMVSHELRTPVSTIGLSIANYQKYKEKLSEDQREKIFDIIDLNAKNLSQLVEDLLILAHIEEQRIKLKWEKN